MKHRMFWRNFSHFCRRGWGPVTKGLKPMSHARIQDFCWGGGWSRTDSQKTTLTTFLFFHQHFISEEITFPRYQRGPIIFPRGFTIFQGGGGGGSNFFQCGGFQMLFWIETHITCEFSGGGGGGPLSPFWIRTWMKFSVWPWVFLNPV